MHLCWRTSSQNILIPWRKVSFINGTEFYITFIQSYEIQPNPQIIEFSHKYGETVYKGDKIWFSFANSTHGYPNVVPSSHFPFPGKLIVHLAHFPSNEYVFVSQEFDNSNDPNQGSVQCRKQGEQPGK